MWRPRGEQLSCLCFHETKRQGMRNLDIWGLIDQFCGASLLSLSSDSFPNPFLPRDDPGILRLFGARDPYLSLVTFDSSATRCTAIASLVVFLPLVSICCKPFSTLLPGFVYSSSHHLIIRYLWSDPESAASALLEFTV